MRSTAISTSQGRATTFHGFEPLTANYIYCPNQLFDVCLPNHSRGATRLVCYLLSRTLGWLDKSGNPIEQDISVSYRELIKEAGISRGAIRKVVDEAIAGKFICCTREGRKNGNGQAAQSAQFRLRWDAEGDYHKDPAMFQGFYAGEGHRSPIPNAFFAQVVPRESLAVVKVVGTVLRHTVGYQNQFGGRRSQASLSYSYIQKFMNLRSRANLSRALRHATEVGYIRCVEPGCVSPSSTKRKPATYAVKWLEEALHAANGSKKEPAEAERFKKGTSNGSERKPAGRFKKGTKEKTVKNNSFKQQDVPSAVAAENMMSYVLLRDAGFDEEVATELARYRSSEAIQRQIGWLEHRNPQQNRLGLLRRAIEGNWSEPSSGKENGSMQADRQEQKQRDSKQEAEEAAIRSEQKRRKQSRSKRLSHWKTLSDAKKRDYYDRALTQATSPSVCARLRRHRDLNNPASEVLAVMATESGASIGESS